MAGHAQLKFVMTECSKTQIGLTRPINIMIFKLLGLLNEPHHKKTCLRDFFTRLDTNQPAQLQKQASHDIANVETRDIILFMQRTTKALIRLRGSASLLFAYGISRFSHDMAQMETASK